MAKNKAFNHIDNLSLALTQDIDPNNRRIFLFGDAENSNLVMSSLTTLVKGLSLLEALGNETINIILSTCGGEDEIGLAMYDAIKSTKCPIRIYCLGRCYSLGTIILQAADERLSFPNTRFMIHSGIMNFGTGAASYASVKTDLEEMDKALDFMINLFESRSKLSGKNIRALCNKGDYYFGSEEALKMGFIDEIVEEIK